MLDSFTAENFEKHVGKKATIKADDGSCVEVELAEVQLYKQATDKSELEANLKAVGGGYALQHHRQGFGVIFAGSKDEVMQEGLHLITIEGEEGITAFIQPVQSPGEKQEYELSFT